MTRGYALLILLLLTMPIAMPTHAKNNTEGVDCQFLLIMADKILKEATVNPGRAHDMATDLYNISLPSELRDPHREFYDAVLKLLYTMKSIESGDPWSVIYNLTSVYSNLQKAYQIYASRLSSCSSDPQVSATVRVSAGLTITRSILPMVRHDIESLLSRESHNDVIRIMLGKTEYIPGEMVEIAVDLNGVGLENIALGIVEWPTLTPFKYLQANITNNTLVAEFTTPSASKLKTLPLYAFLWRSKQLSLAVIVSGELKSTGERVIAYRVFNVTYRVPQLQIQTPETIQPGENVTFTIVSDGLYTNVSIGANGVPLFNTTLYPGPNNYTFNPADYGLQREDMLVLNVRVPPGDTYLGTERSKPIIVTAIPPGVAIQSSSVLVTWTGWATVEIDVNTTSPVRVKASLGPIPLHETMVEEGNNTVSFLASILPLTPVTVSVSAGELRLSQPILVVNPAYTALLVAVILVVMAYSTGLEQFMWIPLKMPRAGIRERTPISGRGYSLVYRRIQSRIAELYYRSLLRLKQTLPGPSQTLREHYKTLKLPGKVKEALWSLLRMVEEDLYSNHKPVYEEALKLLKRVFKR